MTQLPWSARQWRLWQRERGESFRWFKAFPATNYVAADAAYRRGAGTAAQRLYIEQTLPDGALCLVWHSKSVIADAQFGSFAAGATMISVMPDEARLARYDRVVLCQRTFIERALLVRGGGDSDALPHTPAVSLIDVRDGTSAYALGSDCTLSGDSVLWTGPNQPVAGAVYAAEYSYQPTYTYLDSGEGNRLPWPGGDGTLMPQDGLLTQRTIEFV